jgi:branched-chain amino acid transport system permease protein
VASLLRQTAANTLVSASVIVAIGLGFGLVHRAGRFFHLAQGAVFALAAFAAWTLHTALGLPQWIAFPLALATASAAGVAVWFLVYRPIWRAAGGPLALLIGGIGAELVVRNLLSLLYGDATLSMRSPIWGDTVALAGAHLSLAQLSTIALALLAIGATALSLRWSRFGRELRAVGDSPELAASVGIDSERVLTLAFAFGSLIAGSAGLLSALDTDLRPTMGVQPLLLGIAASIVGGGRGTIGVAGAAVAFSLVQNAGAWVIPVRWAEPLALLALVLTLCVRPRGLWSEQRRLE